MFFGFSLCHLYILFQALVFFCVAVFHSPLIMLSLSFPWSVLFLFLFCFVPCPMFILPVLNPKIFSPTPITLWWKLLCWGSSETFSWTWNWFRSFFVCGLFSLASLILFTLSSLILVLCSLVESFLRWHTWHHLSGLHKNLWPLFFMLPHPSFCVILRCLYGRSERKLWNLQSHPLLHGIIPL